MVRMRSGWLVAVALVSISASACKKDDNKDKPAEKSAEKTPDKQPENKFDQAKIPPPAAIASGAGDDLSLLPVDSEMVMGLNFAQLQQSALWKEYAPKFMDKAAPGLAKFKAACGFDPMEAVKSVSIGMKNLGAGKPDGAVVIHGMEKSKVMGACLDKAKEAAAKEGTTIAVDGDVINVKDKSGTASAFTFVNDNTLLGVMGANGNKDGVKQAAAGTSALKSSQAFVDMYSKINTSDSLWLLMNGSSKVFDKMAGMGVKPKALFGSLNVTDGLSVDFRMRVDTPDQAAQLANMGKSQAAGAKQYFDKFDIGNDGADLKVSLSMSPQKLKALAAQFGGMLQQMGGMGGGGMGGP
jgi:hypothetical protein